MTDPNYVEIRHIRCEQHFGRPILYGQLYSPIQDKMLFVGSLAQIIQFVVAKGFEITNAQEILKTVVLDNGFGA